MKQTLSKAALGKKQLNAALHFLGKLENKSEKDLKPDKITYKEPCESFRPERERGEKENVPHHIENGATYL